MKKIKEEIGVENAKVISSFNESLENLWDAHSELYQKLDLILSNTTGQQEEVKSALGRLTKMSQQTQSALEDEKKKREVGGRGWG